MDIFTNYGELMGVTMHVLHPNGIPDIVQVSKPTTLRFPFGSLVPLHSVEDHGRRRETPLLFFEDGTIRSLPLQSRTDLYLACGDIPAESITFYQTGEIRRVFPSAGKLSGYWTEEQEGEEAPLCEINIGNGILHAKVINLHLYRSGKVQSITFWPDQRVSLPSCYGGITVRSGVSFYEDGTLKSYEPVEAIAVETPLGEVMAYDNQPLGITADVNSLQFSPTGEVVAVTTVNTRVRVFPCDDMPEEFGPKRVQSFCEEADTEVKALRIRFHDGDVIFGDAEEKRYPLATTQFECIHSKARIMASHCSG